MIAQAPPVDMRHATIAGGNTRAAHAPPAWRKKTTTNKQYKSAVRLWGRFLAPFLIRIKGWRGDANNITNDINLENKMGFRVVKSVRTIFCGFTSKEI
jgi:hypothetical protein